MPDEQKSLSILIVDHDSRSGKEIFSFFRTRDYPALWVNDGEKAANHLDRFPVDAIITEFSHDRIDGLKLMQLFLSRNPEGCCIFIIQPSEVEAATEAMKQGAHDFQHRPINLAKVEAVIHRAAIHQQLSLDQVELKRRVDDQYGLGRLIGRSRPMAHIYPLMRQAGMVSDPILITGAPGAGKSIIAQTIHQNSLRRDAPLVRLDCAALDEGLLARALFGEAAGRQGALTLADRGTLVLHEADRIAPPIQEHLARWLDTGRFPRHGDGKSLRSAARLIMTSRQRLTALASGAFNEKLLAYLRPMVIETPALRERTEDIPLLIASWLEQAGDKAPALAPEALDVLMRYDWPDNVRELENVIAGMTAIARPGAILTVNAVPAAIRKNARPARAEIRVPVGVPMTVIERAAIEETMRHCDYDKVACAKMLGIGLRTLYRRLDDYDRDTQGVTG